ncbi:MAG: alpha-hydroxy acid oxidase [Acidobacteriota bacterium]
MDESVGAVNVSDFEDLAAKRMPRGAFDYYAGGAEDEQTLRANREGFGEIFLRPRMLAGLGAIDTRTTVLGTPVSLPALVAPTAFQKLADPAGECATARAAGRCGTLMTLSTISSTGLEEVAAAASGPLWFQLYVYKDREITRELLRRAKQAGYKAIVLTVDTPVLGRRERDVRNGFRLPPGIRLENLAWLESEVQGITGWSEASSFWSYVHEQLDASLSWDVVSWLRSETTLPVLLKGVLTAEDARLAIEHGAAAVIVSNHGGRQLDGAPATIRVLPEVVDAVAGRGEVLVDGGVRRGTDILKAVGLGARAVLLGRPVLWGLAAAGEEGVVRVFDLLRAELEVSMALCGASNVSDIGRSLIAPFDPANPGE